MQPIERYGLAALLFLVVLVAAVVLWDRGQSAEDAALQAAAPAPEGQPRVGATSPVAGPPANPGAASSRQAAGPQRQTAQGPRYESQALEADQRRRAEEQAAAERRAARQRLEAQLMAELDAEARERSLEGSREAGPGEAPGAPSSAVVAGPNGAAGSVRPTSAEAPAAPAAGAQTPAGAPAMGLGPMNLASAPAGGASSGATSGTSTRPATTGPRQTTVQTGETLSHVAQRELGRASRWREIAALNPEIDPNRVVVGQVLRLPEGEAVAAAPASSASPAASPTATRAAGQGTPPATGSSGSAPAASGARTVQVASGDSLWRIAERELGDGNRFREIAALNPGVDPNRLAAGTRLVLPAGEPAAAAPAPTPSVARAQAQPSTPPANRVR